jgi:hypothetical protein
LVTAVQAGEDRTQRQDSNLRPPCPTRRCRAEDDKGSIQLSYAASAFSVASDGSFVLTSNEAKPLKRVNRAAAWPHSSKFNLGLQFLRLPIKTRYWWYVAVLVAIVAVYGVALRRLYNPNDPLEFWKYTGLFLGPMLVTFGWVFTNEVNIRNSRRQHTITLIMQYFTNTQRIDDKEEIYREVPSDKTIDQIVQFADLSQDLLRTVTRELNYFEFLASAILSREIDGKLMHRVFQDIVIRHGKTLGPFIKHCRTDSASTWADFVELYEQWKRPGDPKLS